MLVVVVEGGGRGDDTERYEVDGWGTISKSTKSLVERGRFCLAFIQLNT
jgi:hypothetical protein